VWSEPLKVDHETLIHPTAHLLFRFTEDMKADKTISEHVSGFYERLCVGAVSRFFEENANTNNMRQEQASPFGLKKHVNNSNMSREQASFLTRTNLIARWANLGYVKEAVIRNHILQSLISLPILHDHQANALIILFTLAGAAFGAYTNPSVIDRCFELFNGHYDIHDLAKRKLVEVRALCVVKGGRRLRRILRRYPVSGRMVGKVSLLPPPPVFATGKPKPAGADQKDSAATPVITSLGLPSRGLEHQIPQPSPLEPVATPETATIPGSPVQHSPSISIASLSDFTIADASDDVVSAQDDRIRPPADPPHAPREGLDGKCHFCMGQPRHQFL